MVIKGTPNRHRNKNAKKLTWVLLLALCFWEALCEKDGDPSTNGNNNDNSDDEFNMFGSGGSGGFSELIKNG